MKKIILCSLLVFTMPTGTNAFIHKNPQLLERVGYKPYNSLNQKELKCLTDNIYHEAKNEKSIGKKAVAFVTLNRLKKDYDGEYPNSLCGIVYQRNRYKCQFSWVCSKRKPIEDYKLYKKCSEVAKSVMINYGYIPDITRGATNFHRNDIRPKWASPKKRTVIIGKHLFYKL